MISAIETASDVASGRRSASEVSAAALEGVGDDPLNAYTHLSEKVSKRLSGTAPSGRLAGVPIALKDLIDQAGETTTCGSGFYRETPQTSATIVERLEADGATIIGRTGLHEFAFGFSSENHWFGPVLNPWDGDSSTGGSSGGSAATVAAGHVPIAIGTDTGGSVRVPAAMCGVFGLKVTHGRVPLTGVFPLAPSLDTVGPLARSIDDLNLAYESMRGYDQRDPWSTGPPGSLSPPKAIRRVGVPRAWIDQAPVTTDVRSGFDRAVNAISDLGFDVVEIANSLLGPASEANAAAYAEVAAVHGAWFGDGKPYGPDVGTRIEEALAVTMHDLANARSWRSALRRSVARTFESVDALVTPTVGSMKKVIGQDTIAIGGIDHHYRRVLACFTAVVNHLGVPALAMPLTVKGAPPPSLQVVGPKWSETRLMEFGRQLEQAEVVAFSAPSGI